MKYIQFYNSIIGTLTIVADNKYLNAILFDNQIKYTKENPNKITNLTSNYLNNYFNNKEIKLDIILNPYGTQYQQNVWKLLLDVKYGNIKTYKDIKELYEIKYNKKTASIAIGQAISKNPIPIIIPCHRIIGSNNTLTGYAGGLNKKEILLKHEGITSINY
ncbi:MAG: methylated-DNA--[protein]-cysteine S-methyltransferase [Erysipelotrichaceae bacterium]|jgi:methylated-DNA-[protein]-cysteine S-methyltransferase